jgi:hypothetical protein
MLNLCCAWHQLLPAITQVFIIRCADALAVTGGHQVFDAHYLRLWTKDLAITPPRR